MALLTGNTLVVIREREAAVVKQGWLPAVRRVAIGAACSNAWHVVGRKLVAGFTLRRSALELPVGMALFASQTLVVPGQGKAGVIELGWLPAGRRMALLAIAVDPGHMSSGNLMTGFAAGILFLVFHIGVTLAAVQGGMHA